MLVRGKREEVWEVSLVSEQIIHNLVFELGFELAWKPWDNFRERERATENQDKMPLLQTPLYSIIKFKTSSIP